MDVLVVPGDADGDGVCLGVVDDRTDGRALRSPLFGCGDDDLWSWKSGHGSFNILAPVPDERAKHPVGQALSYLRNLHYRARWSTPSELLAALI